ncbi:MAG: reverse transcriptase domain-containing protein [Acidobacteriota bacterium]|nr:reverse transcriptase domain-containing protein [Acidobacteriota bacterium]
MIKLSTTATNGLPAFPTTFCNRSDGPYSSPEVVIFVDGGMRVGGATSAALVCYELLHDGTVHTSRHARFATSSTSNAGEIASMIGAFALIRRFYKDRRVNVYGDSQLTTKFICENAQPTKPHLVPLVQQARMEYASLAGYVVLSHMKRDLGNPADKAANECMDLGTDLGDASLFPDLPVIRSKDNALTKRVPAPVLIEREAPEPLAINTLDDFLHLRFYKTRGSVPPQACGHWGAIVGRTLRKAAAAPTVAEREAAIVEFFTLPTRYLPENSSSTRIVKHLQTDTPFNIKMRVNNRPQRDRDDDDKVERLKEAAHRLAMDQKLKTVNKLINNGLDGDIPFDEKVEMLQRKLVPREEDEVFEAFPREEVPMFSANELKNALKAINRQCATSIDGWTKDLLQDAMRGAPGIEEDLTFVLHYLLTQELGTLLGEIMRAARLIGIVKPAGGIRPIAIASLFLKILGTIALSRDGIKPSREQYAIGRKDGCLTIIHELYADMARLRVLDPDGEYVYVKFDMSNAFNAIRRAFVKLQLQGHSSTTRQYFRLTYGAASSLAVYGAGQFKTLMMDDGVRQGDSTSSYFFCIGVDGALRELVQKNYLCKMYCDDLTMIVRKRDVEQAMADVTAAFAKIGLSVNADKTDVYDPSVPRYTPFVILGADFACTRMFEEEKIAKQMKYFDTLMRLPLHPQLKITLLRLCGSPRLQYISRCMPPDAIKALTRAFDDRLRAALFQTLRLPPGESIPTEMIYHRYGAGFPNYPDVAPKLFASTRDQLLQGIQGHVELVTSDVTILSRRTAQHNLDAEWLWYDGELSPAQFIAAYCIRLGFLPPHLRVHPTKCACGTVVTNDHEQIDHSLRCDHFTQVKHYTRHNIVRDAIARVCTLYGITTVKEPRVYHYDSGKKRPDLLFSTGVPVATDITIVQPVTDVPGKASKAADKEKKKIHDAATKALGHCFISGACEVYGLIGTELTSLIKYLADDLPRPYQWGFRIQLTRSIAVALAQGRASAVFGTKWALANSFETVP